MPIDVRALGVDLLSSRLTSSVVPRASGPLGEQGRRPPATDDGGRRSVASAPGRRTWRASSASRGGAACASGPRRRGGARRPARRPALGGYRSARGWRRAHGPASRPRSPNTLNVSFPGCSGESLVVLLDLAGIAVSAGSACAAGARSRRTCWWRWEGPGDGAQRLRLSVGPGTTDADVERVLAVLPELVAQVRRGAAA